MRGKSFLKIKICYLKGEPPGLSTSISITLEAFFLGDPCNYMTMVWKSPVFFGKFHHWDRLAWKDTIAIVNTQGEHEKNKPRKHTEHRNHPAGSFMITLACFLSGLVGLAPFHTLRGSPKDWDIFVLTLSGNQFPASAGSTVGAGILLPTVTCGYSLFTHCD